MSPVSAREDAVSVSPIIGRVSSFLAVFSHRKGNEHTTVQSADLLLKIGKDGNERILEEWNHVTSF
jgi:hypothetical protein